MTDQEVIQVIRDNGNNLDGLKIKFTSTLYRLVIEGTIIGVRVKRKRSGRKIPLFQVESPKGTHEVPTCLIMKIWK